MFTIISRSLEPNIESISNMNTEPNNYLYTCKCAVCIQSIDNDLKIPITYQRNKKAPNTIRCLVVIPSLKAFKAYYYLHFIGNNP